MMNWFDSYDFGQWAMVKYPGARIPRTPKRIAEYNKDKSKHAWPARTQETITQLRKEQKQ
jgi:hypothetical protein